MGYGDQISSGNCVFVCAYVCVHSLEGKWLINTKLGTHILYGSCAACVDPEVKRSKVYENHHGHMAVSEMCCCVRCATVAGVGVHVI